jgi:hypothetical protein
LCCPAGQFSFSVMMFFVSVEKGLHIRQGIKKAKNVD